MSKTKITTSFGKYSDANLEQKAELILDSLENNAFFTTPVPPLADLQSAVTAFDLSIIKAKEGGKIEQLQRENKRNELIAVLNKLALYVQLEGDGNNVALLSSGFSLSKTPQTIGVLPKPQHFKIIPKTSGIVNLSLKTIYGAKSYQYEYRKKGDTIWQVQLETKPTVLLTGLTSGTEYEFRVTAIGSNSQRIYSDVLSSFIL